MGITHAAGRSSRWHNFLEVNMKKCIMVGYEEEKLLALRMYAEQRGVSVEEELAQAATILNKS